MLKLKYHKIVIVLLGALACLSSSPFAKANDAPLPAASHNEIRIGLLQHDIGKKLKNRYEKGVDINGEYLFASPSADFFKLICSPRPHVGASINTRRSSNQFYGGITWHFDMTQLFFVEASFGGEVHSGKLKKRSKHKRALGSRALFRESIGLGANLAERHTASIILDHASNASLAKPNPGLTAFGVRYGYKL